MTFRYALSALALAAVLLAPPAFAAELTKPLPELDHAAAWTVEPGREGFLTAEDAPGAVLVRFRAVKETVAKLLLKTPVPLDSSTTGFTFRATNGVSTAGLIISVLVKDAKDREFWFYTKSPGSYERGVFFPEHSWRRSRDLRFNTAGFDRVKLEPSRDATVGGPRGATPVKPLTLLGLRFEGVHQRPETSWTDVYVHDLVATSLNPQNSALYYQFNDRECYGEVDPIPAITLGELGHWFGKRFTVNWEIRDRYDGKPFMKGGKDFTLDSADKTVPYPMQLAQKIEIPVTTEGTYWVHMKLRWTRVSSPVPDEINQFDYRLYVKKGAKAMPAPLPKLAAAPKTLVDIAPDRASLIYTPAEKFVVPVVFSKPDLADPTFTISVTVTSYGAKDVVKTFTPTPTWDSAGNYTYAADLSTLPAGPYYIDASVLVGGKPLDTVTRIVGKPTPPIATAGPANIPASVASWQEVVKSPKPLFQLSPMPPQDGTDVWTRYKSFMDNLAPTTNEMELQILWRDVEPMPGVYDWGLVDRVVDYAQTKGIKVLLWPAMVGYEPEWLPSCYTENREGSIFGQTAYLFHGARLNYWQAPAIKSAAMRLIAAVPARYRTHPAVRGYFVLAEAPGEAPFNGWFDGFDVPTLANFRDYAKQKYVTLAAVNKAWGTKFTTWPSVAPPIGDALPQYWLDWMKLRTDAISGFLVDGVKVVRGYDTKRPIIIYHDGVGDEQLQAFRTQGCILANGGAHDPERAAISALSSALAGLDERTEDHSPGAWSQYFPTQLDATVFTMAMGGGANTHCKAYMYTTKTLDQISKPPYSFDRYQKFMPIWTELRTTKPLPVDVMLFKDSTAGLLRTKSTYGWGWGDAWMNLNCFQSHLICAEGSMEFCQGAKLVIATGASVRQLNLATIDSIVKYVENGGVLLMRPDTGEVCVETPDQRWALMKRFGIAPPTGDPDNGYIAAKPIAGTMFGEGTPSFVLRNFWAASEQPGMTTLASVERKPGQVAMSWKPFGKGKVIVVWAQTIVPADRSADHGGSYSVLRDVAKWAGARIYTDASSLKLWTNLLKGDDGSTYYALAYRPVWQEDNPPAVSGTVQYTVPDGNYDVTEIISGTSVGTMTASKLKTDGISVKLEPHALGLYRLRRL
ncbi:MAG TPA: beta-galactosidase [Capsulimonadaceae bacterium]|jgi:hypothetical protein